MQKERESGLDLLRILAMGMIVLLHALGNGLLDAAVPGTAQNVLFWTLEAACYGSVNIFFLMTGYLTVRSPFRIKRLLVLWAEVFFYSVGLYALCVLCGFAAFSPVQLLCSLLPVVTGRYWFFSVYFALSLLSPFLNRLLTSLSKRASAALTLTLLALTCVWPNVMLFSGTLQWPNGRGVGWALTLYCAGAFVRLHGFSVHKGVAAGVFVLCVAVTAAEHFAALDFAAQAAAALPDGAERLPTLFYAYNSVPVFLSSAALFLWFRQIRLRRPSVQRIAAAAARCTFAVYLIHNHNAVRAPLWDALRLPSLAQSVWAIPALIAAAAGIFAVCILAESLRRILFRPLFHCAFWDKPDQRFAERRDTHA